MKILIDLTSLNDNFSGIERYAANISYYMIKNSNDDRFILIFKNKIHYIFEEFINCDRVECVILNGKNKLLFNQIKLPWNIRKYKADWYLFLAFPVPILLFKRNMISTIHDLCCWDCPETMKKTSEWYFKISHKIALKKCRYIITISKFSKNRILDKFDYNSKKIILLYCGISNDFKKLNISNEKKVDIKQKYNLPESYILSVSTLEPRKNLKILIEAYQQLILEKKKIADMVLAGRKGWKIDSLLNDIDDEVKKHIFFTGFIDDIDLPYVYNLAECFVFPSKYEGFGIPPLEAMACGVPVISSSASSLPEVLGDAAIYFDCNNINDLKDKLESINSYKNNYETKCINQADLFKWENESEKLLNYLNDF